MFFIPRYDAFGSKRSFVLKTAAQFLGVIILVSVVYAAFLWWQNRTIEIPLEDYGLDAEVLSDTNSYGTIIFDGLTLLSEDQENVTWHTFSQNVQSDFSSIEYKDVSNGIEIPNDGYVGLAYTPDSEDMLVPVAFVLEESGERVAVPLPIQSDATVITDLTVSPDGSMYAYAYTSATEETVDLSDWTIAVHTLDTGESQLFFNAAEPDFSMENFLMYMKDDGIHTYEFETGVIRLIMDIYYELELTDDYAFDEEGNILILTALYGGMIAVFNLNEFGYAEEVGASIEPSRSVRHPVISPDTRQYAVLSAPVLNENGDIGELSMVIREIYNEQVILSFLLPEAVLSASLVTWK